jgi:menaquinone-dependent protoporphyrinogen IX oxidase/nitroimidazol reductase NimA-like FMN-containing flavoprotein (pyridoxamine 5'-phosphate oxidase superfamily)
MEINCMQKTLIVYQSKYGSTEDITKIMSMILGPAKYCLTEDFKSEYRDFDFFVIGSPLYKGKLDSRVLDFIKENQKWLSQKPLALFCTCLNRKQGDLILKKLKNKLGDCVLSTKSLGGRLILKELDDNSNSAIKEFLKAVGMPVTDIDITNPEEVVDYSLKLKKLKEGLMPKMPPKELKQYIEDFLVAHNTCTLSTGFGTRVRSTPIEYTYKDGCMYILSEGGEKFANLMLNKNVSAAVYNDYTDMDQLAGMQITGEASIIDDYEEYSYLLDLKGLNINTIKSLPVNLNLIKVTIKKVESLYWKYRKQGYTTKQTLIF